MCRTLAEYVPALPNPAAAGSSAPASMFSNLHINGSPASISEDAMFWKTLSTVAKDRRRPDATCAPASARRPQPQRLVTLPAEHQTPYKHIQISIRNK